MPLRIDTLDDLCIELEALHKELSAENRGPSTVFGAKVVQLSTDDIRSLPFPILFDIVARTMKSARQTISLLKK